MPRDDPQAMASATAVEEREGEERNAIRTETNAMATAFNALQQLSPMATRRALTWLDNALFHNQEPPF